MSTHLPSIALWHGNNPWVDPNFRFDDEAGFNAVKRILDAEARLGRRLFDRLLVGDVFGIDDGGPKTLDCALRFEPAGRWLTLWSLQALRATVQHYSIEHDIVYYIGGIHRGVNLDRWMTAIRAHSFESRLWDCVKYIPSGARIAIDGTGMLDPRVCAILVGTLEVWGYRVLLEGKVERDTDFGLSRIPALTTMSVFAALDRHGERSKFDFVEGSDAFLVTNSEGLDYVPGLVASGYEMFLSSLTLNNEGSALVLPDYWPVLNTNEEGV